MNKIRLYISILVLVAGSVLAQGTVEYYTSGNPPPVGGSTLNTLVASDPFSWSADQNAKLVFMSGYNAISSDNDEYSTTRMQMLNVSTSADNTTNYISVFADVDNTRDFIVQLSEDYGLTWPYAATGTVSVTTTNTRTGFPPLPDQITAGVRHVRVMTGTNATAGTCYITGCEVWGPKE